MKRRRLHWRGMLLIILGVASFAILMDRFGWQNIVQPMIVALSSLPYLVWFKWELRREGWFRMVVVVMIAVHEVLIVLVPWRYQDVPGRAVGGAFVIDVCLMLAVVNGVGVWVDGHKKVVTLRGARKRLAQGDEGVRHL